MGVAAAAVLDDGDTGMLGVGVAEEGLGADITVKKPELGVETGGVGSVAEDGVDKTTGATELWSTDIEDTRTVGVSGNWKLRLGESNATEEEETVRDTAGVEVTIGTMELELRLQTGVDVLDG